MTLRKKLNNTIEKMPYIGDVLTTPLNRKGLVSLALGITGAASLSANAGMNIEAFYGHDNSGEKTEIVTTLDSKVGGSVGDMGYFMRTLLPVNHTQENIVDPFVLIDLSYPIGNGLNLMQETQFTGGMPADPRIGMFWAKNFKKGSAYAHATRNWSVNPNTEFDLLLEYSPQSSGMTPYAQWESILNMSDKEFNYSKQRIRLGARYKDFTFGAAADVSGIGSGNEPTYYVGGFARVNVK